MGHIGRAYRTELEELSEKYQRFIEVLDDAADHIHDGDDSYFQMSRYLHNQAIHTLERVAFAFGVAKQAVEAELENGEEDPRHERGYFGDK